MKNMKDESSKDEIVSRAEVPIIDRRTQGGKSIGNRERFLRRNKPFIQDAVKRILDGRSIQDIDKGAEIHIPKRDMSQPVFGHGAGGRRKNVHPGNKEYVVGDRIERPEGGGRGGSGKGQASDSGEGEDDFVFNLTKQEILEYLFDECALPNLERKVLAETPEFKSMRAGFTTDGAQSNLSLIRSMRGAIGRRIVFRKVDRLKLLECLEEMDALESACYLQPVNYAEEHDALVSQIDALETEIGHDPKVEAMHSIAERIAMVEAKLNGIPYLDPIDLRFRARVRIPVPTTKAVMFCLMDVSGSMDEARKNLAKRFFILLYLFLTKHYEKIDVVFIRHHTQAIVVNEHDFFHALETGGTIVSSALTLMDDVIKGNHPDYKEGFPTSEWNIYGAQISDGDNWHHDSGRCTEILSQKILPVCRYYAYIQVAKEEQNLWDEYANLTQPHFAMRKASEAKEIFPVFRDLFKKETT